MKKISILCSFLLALSSTVFAGGGWLVTIPGTDNANFLAGEWLIVSQSDPSFYRLSDTMLRQELIGTALRLADVDLPVDYACRGYFSDATFGLNSSDAWVCRAFEIGADHSFVTRANKTTRPRDAVTRAEALAIVVQASGITLAPDNYTSNWLKSEWFADWQTKLLSSLTDCRIFNHGKSCEDGKDGNIAMGNFRPNEPATRADVFEFLMYTPQILAKKQAECIKLFETETSGIDDFSSFAFEALTSCY